MRILIQRTSRASVELDKNIYSQIGVGLVILLGIEDSDNEEDIEWLTNKIVNLRVFDDEKGVMNKSIKDIGGDILLVPQFTLMASTKKGNRPSYIKASRPETAIPIYTKFIEHLQSLISKEIKTGKFGADMKLQLVNDGPVTIWMDSKRRE